MAAMLLRADNIVAGYLPEVDILNGCSVSVDRGEAVGMLGPNGAGKSTLLKTIFGLVPVREGTVHLGDQPITGLPPHSLVARGVGYVPQVANVFPNLSVADNLRMGLYQRPKAWDERLQHMMELFPIVKGRLSERVGLLSGGERQMVAMARALMMSPSVLLLDEPSAGLSPINQDALFLRIRDISNTGVAVLLVEQNVRRCLEICHRAYILDQGRDAYTGTGADLMHDPKVVELYLGILTGAR